jgi:hypothetical protein
MVVIMFLITNIIIIILYFHHHHHHLYHHLSRYNISYLIPADKGVLNSNITEFFETSNEADTISLILLSIFVNSASFAAVTPNLVLKNMLPKAPCLCTVEENGKWKMENGK